MWIASAGILGALGFSFLLGVILLVTLPPRVEKRSAGKANATARHKPFNAESELATASANRQAAQGRQGGVPSGEEEQQLVVGKEIT